MEFKRNTKIRRNKMKIKLTKFAPVDFPKFPTPKKEDFNDGQENEGISLPVDYWIIGELQREIKEGQSIKVLREERNGEKIMGIFTSSPVVKIDGGRIETANSQYNVEYLDKEPIKVEPVVVVSIEPKL
jgi:hypothetical protein